MPAIWILGLWLLAFLVVAIVAMAWAMSDHDDLRRLLLEQERAMLQTRLGATGVPGGEESLREEK